MSEDVRVVCRCGAVYEPDESCPKCGTRPRAGGGVTMAEALDQRDAALTQLVEARDQLRLQSKRATALFEKREAEWNAENARLRAVVESVPGIVEKVMRQVRADRGSPLAGDPDTIRDHVRDALAQLDVSEEGT
jgi:hypothetical protein